MEPDYKKIVELLFKCADVCPFTCSPDWGGLSMTISFPGDHIHIGRAGGETETIEESALALERILEHLVKVAPREKFVTKWKTEQKILAIALAEGIKGE